MDKPVCYMLVGLPGSGKSTQAKEMVKEMPYLRHVSQMFILKSMQEK